jgi:isopentenyldiphosphate isomerase
MDIEYLDLVDDNDIVIGKLQRQEFYQKKLKNFRTVHLFLRNDEGKLWIPRRTKDKSTFPWSLDCSMAWHVTSGESYNDALIREMQEELNLNIPISQLKFLWYVNPFKLGFQDFPCFTENYELQTNSQPDYNSNDFSWGEWLFPREILERLHDIKEPPGKDILPKLIQLYYI